MKYVLDYVRYAVGRIARRVLCWAEHHGEDDKTVGPVLWFCGACGKPIPPIYSGGMTSFIKADSPILRQDWTA